MQIKTTIKYHLTSVRMVMQNRFTDIENKLLVNKGERDWEATN